MLHSDRRPRLPDLCGEQGTQRIWPGLRQDRDGMAVCQAERVGLAVEDSLERRGIDRGALHVLVLRLRRRLEELWRNAVEPLQLLQVPVALVLDHFVHALGFLCVDRAVDDPVTVPFQHLDPLDPLLVQSEAGDGAKQSRLVGGDMAQRHHLRKLQVQRTGGHARLQHLHGHRPVEDERAGKDGRSSRWQSRKSGNARGRRRSYCGINNVSAITRVLRPTVAKQQSEFYRRRGEEERPFFWRSSDGEPGGAHDGDPGSMVI